MFNGLEFTHLRGYRLIRTHRKRHKEILLAIPAAIALVEAEISEQLGEGMTRNFMHTFMVLR